MEHGIRASLNRLARMSLISVVLCAGCADHSSVDELFSSDPLPDGTEIAVSGKWAGSLIGQIGLGGVFALQGDETWIPVVWNGSAELPEYGEHVTIRGQFARYAVLGVYAGPALYRNRDD